MTAAAIPMPSIRYGSPRDWDKFFWRMYHEAFLEILHCACDPDGQERWIDGECKRRHLRPADSSGTLSTTRR
jgi:hypothetical protein